MPEIVITADSSPTLYVPELDETYHSRNGSVAESLHVFIASGLHQFPASQSIRILEVGLGTGLNVLLTLKETDRDHRTIDYHAIDTLPLESALVRQLNFTPWIGADAESDLLQLHSAPWNSTINLRPQFLFTKHLCPIQDFKAASGFDLIYFDAFGPDKQPELWSPEVFTLLYALMNPGAILVTYAAKGSFRRTLRSCGFEVERIPGPPGKRHMTRGKKQI